jgi:CO/xanthine dehydrogenase FAD-binding subunit
MQPKYTNANEGEERLLSSTNTYLRPRTVNDALDCLSKHGESARILAGGTGLYELSRQKLLSGVVTQIDIQDIGLDYVKRSEGFTIIGSAVTFTEMIRNSLLNTGKELSAIVEATQLIRPVQVRNVGTIGGTICMGLPFLDLPCALLALDASVVLRSVTAERTVNLKDFIKGYFQLDLAENELLIEVKIPTREPFAFSAFQKFAMTGDDWAIANLAAWVSSDPKGKVKDARIFAGGVGDNYVELIEAENALRDKGLSEEVVEEASDAASRSVEPASDMRASSSYRKKLLKVLSKRAYLSIRKRMDLQ